MRLLINTLLTMVTVTVFPLHVKAADLDGARQYCQEKLNKRGSYNCDCIVDKYYPKKVELEKAWGVPIEGPEMIAVYVINACTEVAKSSDHEYRTCMQSPAFKKGKVEFGDERFCKCYSDEWEKQLSGYLKKPNAVIDKNSKSYLKGLARTKCRKKLR
ncbi:MAG: hypothetical protein ACRBB3_02840 [Alphaproteobacteria bacterium]